MNAEFFSAIEDLEKEKGIPREYMYDKIKIPNYWLNTKR